MIPTSKEIRASLLATYRTNDELNANPHQVVPVPALVTLIMKRMNIAPSEWDRAADKIKAHLQNCTDYSGQEEKKSNVLTSVRGGVCLKEGVKF